MVDIYTNRLLLIFVYFENILLLIAYVQGEGPHPQMPGSYKLCFKLTDVDARNWTRVLWNQKILLVT